VTLADFLQPLDIYCERTDVGFFSEPLNLFTNLAFIVSGLVCLKMLGVRSQFSAQLSALKTFSWLIILIGLGSALFHSVAEMWSQIFDVVPIMVFILLFIGFFLRSLLKKPWSQVVIGYAMFFLLSSFFAGIVKPEWVNGSNNYFSSLLFLVYMAVELRRCCQRFWPNPFAVAAMAFFAALVFRSVDLNVCPYFPLGTHFLWHVMNSIVLYNVISGATLMESDQSRMQRAVPV
jgi:hypothetical protein